MKPQIDQSLLDQIPMGGPIFDFTFSDSIEDNTGIFHVCYTMKDDREEVALVNRMSIQYEPKLLN